jgi:hypothetical protein
MAISGELFLAFFVLFFFGEGSFDRIFFFWNFYFYLFFAKWRKFSTKDSVEFKKDSCSND